MKRPSVQFLGAAGTVTGSRHLLRIGGRQVLLDCGLFQGLKELRLRNWDEPPFDPRKLDAVVLSHAHLDHSGALPLLMRRGFRGPIHCSPATGDLLRILLLDAARLEEEAAERANRRGYSKHRPALPLFTADDALAALGLVEHRGFGQPFAVTERVTALLRRAGHILGAATIELQVDAGSPLRLVYSGDLGRPDRPILRDPEPISAADVLVLESTYGDRVHPQDSGEALARIVREAAERGAALLVPAFAVGRAQELLWWLERLEAEARIPSLPLYVDSPMALDVTEIYTRHPGELDAETVGRAGAGGHLLVGARCRLARTPAESKALNHQRGPLIIISASGMATGGRILHHLALRLPDPRTTVLLVGFQAAGTRGRLLREGARQMRMLGQDVPVRARIETMDGLSAHADRDETLRWLAGFERPPRQTYLVHGEPLPAEALAEGIRGQLGWSARPARDGEEVDLEG